MSFYLDGLGDISTRVPRVQQGDIVARVPFVALAFRQLALLDVSKKSVAEVDLISEDTLTGGQIVVEFRVSLGVVVTQTCDLERKTKPIVLAPAISCQSLKPNDDPSSQSFKSKWDTWENPGKLPSAFPLPPFSTTTLAMPCSLVDFTALQSFPVGQLDFIEKSVVARLSADALAKFQERLSYCFGRFAAPLGLFSF